MNDIFNRQMITAFNGEHAFLSNFFDHPVTYRDIVWPTAEHAYQAMKCLCDDEFAQFRRYGLTAGQAKRLGRKVTVRPDWESVKLSVMEAIVSAKFSEPLLAEKLLATGDAILIEGNTWGDRFWGECDGEGANHLGLILMYVRGKINP